MSAAGDEPLIVLIGLRGSGKSTVGAAIAKSLGRSFADLDDCTLDVLGEQSVQEAWRRQGEPSFRAAEVEAFRNELRTRDSGVLALGGGTPTAPGAEEILREAQDSDRIRIVYLRAEAETLAKRIRADLSSGDTSRPSLTGDDPVSESAQVLKQRDPLYSDLADVIVDAGASTDDVVRQILEAIRNS